MALVQHPVGMMPHQYDERTASVKEAISMSATQSVRTYSTNQEYLYAMREDLADWLKVCIMLFVFCAVFSLVVSFDCQCDCVVLLS